MSCYANPVMIDEDPDREEWARRVQDVIEHYQNGPLFDFRSVRPSGDPLPSCSGTLPVRGSEAGPNMPRPEEGERGDP